MLDNAHPKTWLRDLARRSVPVSVGALILVGLLSLDHSEAQAQSTKFEVASIRPAAPTPTVPSTGGGGNAPPPPPGGGCMGRRTMDAGRYNLVCVSMKSLLLDAFGVAQSRLVAPDWTDTQQFDISAKLPEGASQERLPAMVRSLLEERFKLAFHRQSEDGPINALVVSKGGPALKPAPPAQPAWAVEAAAGGSYGAGNIGGIQFRSIPVPSATGPAVVYNSPAMGYVRRSSSGGPQGTTRYEAPSITMEGLAHLAVVAGNGLDPAVVDMTGLQGRYQLELVVCPTPTSWLPSPVRARKTPQACGKPSEAWSKRGSGESDCNWSRGRRRSRRSSSTVWKRRQPLIRFSRHSASARGYLPSTENASRTLPGAPPPLA